MVIELDVGVPETQYVVREGSRWAAADVRVGRHLFEFDGRVKYLGRDRGGVADRPVEDVLWDEKLREDWLRRADGGYDVSRVVWSDLLRSGTGSHPATAARRVRGHRGEARPVTS